MARRVGSSIGRVIGVNVQALPALKTSMQLRRVWFRVSGTAGALSERGNADEHRAPARAARSFVRLKIWHGAPVVEGSVSLGEGTETDIARLYEREAPRLRRRFTRRLNPEKAADLVQSAFVRLLRLGSERLGELDHPAAYLARTAENLIRDEAKMASRRSESQHVDVDDCPITGPDPLEALEARDMLRRIEAAIPLLPDRTREIFMAHRFEDLTYMAIAERMGLSVRTVEEHISLALRKLHRCLGETR